MLQSKQQSTPVGHEATTQWEAVPGRAEDLPQLSAHSSRGLN